MKETEKLLKLLEEYLKDKKFENEEEYNELIQNFMELNDSKLVDIEETPEMKSMEFFHQALEADSESEMLKFIKASLKENPDNCDAKIFWAEYSIDNIEQLEEEILKIINSEKDRLIKNKIFVKENIGEFYLNLETRPYLRAMQSLVELYMSKGRMRRACELIEEMLLLNVNDNLGMRYRLMSLYCFLEEYDKLEILNEKYNEESPMMLLPLSIYYYKRKKYHMLEKTLEMMNALNKNLISVIMETLNTNSIDSINESHETYIAGSVEEAEMIVEGNLYLLAVTSGYINYLANWKPSKNFKLS